MANTRLQCPYCQRIDNVQKVTAIVSAGISTGTYRGYADGAGYTSHGPVVMDEAIYLSGSSQTYLSRILAPPNQPIYQSNEGCIIVILAIGSLLVIWFGIAVAVSSLGTFFPTSITFASIIIALITSLVLGMGCIFVSKRFIKANRKMFEPELARFHYDLERWQRAIARWQELYYCHRCDGVFFPGQLYLVPATMMNDIIYRK
jgi:hypothetical protein